MKVPQPRAPRFVPPRKTSLSDAASEDMDQSVVVNCPARCSQGAAIPINREIEYR
jgi:hypothetical protein